MIPENWDPDVPSTHCEHDWPCSGCIDAYDAGYGGSLPHCVGECQTREDVWDMLDQAAEEIPYD